MRLKNEVGTLSLFLLFKKEQKEKSRWRERVLRFLIDMNTYSFSAINCVLLNFLLRVDIINERK